MEKEMAAHPSIPAWERASVHGVARVGQDLATKPAPPPPITSEITVHRHCNKYNNNNRKFEILYELPKCDTETGSEQMLLENDSDRRLTQVCHKPSIWLNKHATCEASQSEAGGLIPELVSPWFWSLRFQNRSLGNSRVVQRLRVFTAKGTDSTKIPQFSSVTRLCPTLCNPMNCSMPGIPFHH